MSGGGGGQTVVQPSTTTTVQDIPAWEQGYVTNLLGQAQTEAAQPYQQFPGQQIAGFTPDQMQAFQNVEGATAQNAIPQAQALGSATQGANTANSIYGAGSPLINASTMAASPLGIQQYMSPYLNNQLAGLQTLAQQNWNQFTAPGVNNEFVQAGQSGSGRNEQVLGQQANLANQALTAQMANATQNAYTTAGNQAATEAGLLGSAGSTLGNLAATQAGTQLGAGTTLGNLGSQAAATNLNQNTALQAVGQQQQQLNQANLNTAQQNWQNQVNWPEQQTQFLNQIVRGLPAPTATTSAGQSPANTVSPLSGIGGSTLSLAGLGALGGTTNKEGGLIGYKAGGQVKGYSGEDGDSQVTDSGSVASHLLSDDSYSPSLIMDTDSLKPEPYVEPTPTPSQNPLDIPKPPQYSGISSSQAQNLQLLEMARGLLTPQPLGQAFSAIGQGVGNMADTNMKLMQMQQQQQQANYENQMKQIAAQQEQEKIDQGRYTPVKDFYGNVTGMVEGKTGKFTPVNTTPQTGAMSPAMPNEAPSADPQKAAAQILAEQGSVPTQVGNRFDIAGRNKQVDAYNNAQLAAKSTIQQLDALDAQTGKYTSGKAANVGYGTAAALGIDPTGGAAARAEADKASKALANSFMQANVGAKGSGIRMVQFDAGAVPNADMPDAARTDLINKNRAIANSQVQRAVISNMYPRMQMANVNTIMDAYEQKNPPILPSGEANPGWMTYQDWLKAGRPDTRTLTPNKSSASTTPAPQPDLLAAIAAEKARRAGTK